MKRMIAGVCLVGLCAWGADFHFIGITNGVYNVDTNWVETAVPAAADTAYFTAPLTLGFSADSEVARAVFGGTKTNALNTGAYLFRVTDAVDVGPGAADAVTLRPLGGTYAFGQIFATNAVVTVHPTNSAFAATGSNFFDPGWGELTSGGGIICQPNNGAANNANFYIGTLDGKTFTWNITGGVTRIETYNARHNLENVNHTHLGGPGLGARGVLNVSGAGTILTNTAYLNIGAGRTWGQYCGTNSLLTVTGGAKVYANGSYFGFNSGYGTAIIDGPGSEWNIVSAFIVLGKNSWGNRLIVTNGGYCSVKTDIAVGQEGGRFNQLIVAGAGSRVQCTAQLHIGEGSTYTHSNSVFVVDGGYLYAASVGWCSQGTQIGGRTSHDGNKIVVDGPGSFLEIPTQCYYNGSNAWLHVQNGAKGLIKSTPGSYQGGVRVDGVGTVLTSKYCYAAGDQKIVVTNSGTLIYSEGFYPGDFAAGESADIKATGAGSMLSIPNNSVFRMPSKNACAIATRIEQGARFEYNNLNGGWGAEIGYSVGSIIDFTVTDSGSVAQFGGGTFNVAGTTGTVVRINVASGGWLITPTCNLATVTSNASAVITLDGTGSVWSNKTAMTVGRATRDSSVSLVFKADAVGLGTMFVDGLTVADTNSVLKVDLTAYKGAAQSFTLVDYGSLSNRFTPQIVGTEYTGVINQAAPGTKIVLSVFRRGTVLKLY